MSELYRNTKVFWDWFTKHENYIKTIDNNNYSSVLSRIGKALNLFSPNIYCNISPTEDKCKLDVIFTSFGDATEFDNIKRLVSEAPEHIKENWTLYALNPPQKEHINIQLTDFCIHSSTVFFQYSQVDDNKYILFVGVKGTNFNIKDVSNEFILTVSTAVDSFLGEENSYHLIHSLCICRYADLNNPIPIIEITNHIK